MHDVSVGRCRRYGHAPVCTSIPRRQCRAGHDAPPKAKRARPGYAYVRTNRISAPGDFDVALAVPGCAPSSPWLRLASATPTASSKAALSAKKRRSPPALIVGVSAVASLRRIAGGLGIQRTGVCRTWYVQTARSGAPAGVPPAPD
jgi:hypothetical protein